MESFHLRLETKRTRELVDKLAFRHLKLVINWLLTIRKSLQENNRIMTAFKRYGSMP